jgi:hypothetical protein
MEISSHRSTAGCIQALRANKREIWVLMTQGDNQRPGAASGNMLSLDNPGLVLPTKLALVIGGSGVSEQMKMAANRIVYLPQYGFGGPLPVPLMCAMALQLLFVSCPVARGDLGKERKNWLRKRWQAQAILPPIKREAPRESNEFHDAAADFMTAKEALKADEYLTVDAFSSIDWVPSLKKMQKVASRGSCVNLEAYATDPATGKAEGSGWFSDWGKMWGKMFPQSEGSGKGSQLDGEIPTPEGANSTKRETLESSRKNPKNPKTKLFPSCTTLEGLFPPDYKRKSEKGWISDVPKGVFQVRSEGYLKSRLKQNAKGAICTLLGADLFRTSRKADNLSLRIDLPKVPTGFPAAPKLLVVHMQVPQYAPSFFGAELDGDGLSMVWYHAIDYTKVTTAARGLLQRFLENGVEQDGKPTRDRLKLILRLANVEEAVETGAVSRWTV